MSPEEVGWDRERRLVMFRLDKLETKIDEIQVAQERQGTAIDNIAAKLDKYTVVAKIIWILAGAIGTIVGYVLNWVMDHAG